MNSRIAHHMERMHHHDERMLQLHAFVKGIYPTSTWNETMRMTGAVADMIYHDLWSMYHGICLDRLEKMEPNGV